MWLTSLEDRLHSKHEASSSIPTTKSKNSKLFHLPKCTAASCPQTSGEDCGAARHHVAPVGGSGSTRGLKSNIQFPDPSTSLSLTSLARKQEPKLKTCHQGFQGLAGTVPWPQQFLQYNWMGQSGFNSNPWRGEASKEPASSWELTKASSSRQGHQGEKHQCQIIFHSNQGTRAKWRNCPLIPRSNLAW